VTDLERMIEEASARIGRSLFGENTDLKSYTPSMTNTCNTLARIAADVFLKQDPEKPVEDRLVDGMLEWKGHTIELTLAEARVVSELMTSSPRVKTYRELYDIFTEKPGLIVGSSLNSYKNNIRQAVMRIKRKIWVHDPDFDKIESKIGKGYLWRKDS